MAVIRINKNADYTVMSNNHFKEKEMSLKAKGLLSLMLSLPDKWDYSIAGLVTLSKDGKDSVMNALSELEEFGYLKRSRVIDKNGRFSGYDYDIYEKPRKKPNAEKPNTDRPQKENPCAEKPNAEKPPQLNNNSSNTNQSNKKEINKTPDFESEFEILWKIYPRKLGKPKALKAYIKARKAGVTFEQVENGIKAYCKQIKKQKTEIEYVKHGSTWFNGECWNDEYNISVSETAASKYQLDGGINL